MHTAMPFFFYADQAINFDILPQMQMTALPDWAERPIRIMGDWKAGTESYTLYTSGTTGLPSMFVLRRHLLEASARATGETFGIGGTDTLLLALDTSYIGGFMMPIRAMVLQANLVAVPVVAKPLKNLPEGIQPTFASFVPLQMHEMLKDPQCRERLEKMRGILVGGGEVPPPLVAEIEKLKVPVYQTYGMTETYSHVAYRTLNGPERTSRYKPIGAARFGLDGRGCLFINSVMTQDADLVTNDLAELHPDGTFAWLGRADNVINTGGVKVHAEKIETAAIEAMTAIGMPLRAVMAIGEQDGRLGQSLTLLVEGDSLSSAQENHLLDLMKTRLEKYELPRKFRYLDKFSYTDSGKISRAGTRGMV